jgi:hypothetical protein
MIFRQTAPRHILRPMTATWGVDQAGIVQVIVSVFLRTLIIRVLRMATSE